MAAPPPADDARRDRAPGPLRVRLAGPVGHREQAAWALEALLARARVADWVLVDGDDDADLTWGGDERTDVVVHLPAEPGQWSFRWDHAPDAARDPLAATFWWLARVEEQLAPETAFDEHGRFRFADSALARFDDSLAAPVDELALALVAPLAQWRRPRAAMEPTWRLVATHDIDLPWRWTRSGRRRALRGVRGDLRAGRVGHAIGGLVAIAASPLWWIARRDPWSNARRIVQLEAAHDARSTHYLLAGRHVPEDGDAELHERGRRYLHELVGLDDAGDLAGLHGSYTASVEPGRLAQERAALESQLHRPVLDHRFHYLRHRPHLAWSALAAAGIATDASLGYAEQPGFRAGTAHPYRAWDHAGGCPLDLLVIPLALMDASFDERYLGIGASWGAERIASQLLDRVCELGGSASVLFHNDRLCNGAGRAWTALYSRLLEQVRDGNGVACTAADAAASYRALIPSWRVPEVG